jgi:MFS family permease
MPLPLLMGWLSDRIDRRPLLAVGYLSALAALILLPASSVLWQFWLVFVLQGIAVGSNSSIGSAWVTDLVPRELLGKGLAFFGATVWVGGVVGFAVAGSLVQHLGYGLASVLGGCLALAATVLLIPIRAGSRNVPPAGGRREVSRDRT